ncbi:MAG TPA: hypothetical protein VHS78_03500, partial [Candidatus Elarobacter sp.]|nr:hypothetical protein [Candidatus Elarobacter sp.]
MGRIAVIVGFVICAVAAAAASARAACPELATGKITVVEAGEAMRPVAGARVRGPGIDVTTDAAGIALVCVPNGFVDVTIVRGGFEPATTPIGNRSFSHGADVVVRLVPHTLTSIGGTSTSYARVPLNASPGAIA